MKITILGCGGSRGVPAVGGPGGRGDWGDCDPANPKNRRTRSSILVEQGATRILIDTTPDLRQQLLTAGIADLTAVLYTHTHADHIHGIDELRSVKKHMERNVDVYAEPDVLKDLRNRFNYAFEGGGVYSPTVIGHEINGPLTIGGLTVAPFRQIHGPEYTTGFRIGNMAYSTDLNDLPETSYSLIENLDLWILDCLQAGPHPTHTHFDQALTWVRRFRPKRTVLTHLDRGLDYDRLKKRCPGGVEPAYDGMTVTL